MAAATQNRFITPEGLQRMKEYKYQSGLAGYLDTVIMTPFWNRAVEFLPMWLAPNLVTLLSLSAGVASYILLWVLAPNMEETVPGWAFIACAVLLFIYQTLDAIDGKQARRTKASSPLGQLFDHGCDAVFTTLIPVIVATALRSSSSPVFTYVVFLGHIIPFFLSNWEESETHVMRFAFPGVTEAQFFLMSFFIVTGVVGQWMWFITVYEDWKLFHVLVLCVLPAGFYQVIDCFIVTFKHHREKQIPFTPAALRLLQFFIYTGLGTAWILGDPEAHAKYGRFMYLTMGFLFAYQMSRLIVGSVTHSNPEFFMVILFPLPVVALNSFYHFMPAFIAVFAYLGFAAFMYADFVVCAMREICNGLNIRPFIITPPPATPAPEVKKA